MRPNMPPLQERRGEKALARLRFILNNPDYQNPGRSCAFIFRTVHYYYLLYNVVAILLMLLLWLFIFFVVVRS